MELAQLAMQAANSASNNSGVAKSVAIGSILSMFPDNTILGSMGRSMTGSGLTGAQKQQNQFNADQAAITRQWQEYMRGSNYQTAVEDMKKAGLNPAMMYGGTTSGASTPSGANASSGTVAGADLSSLINMAMAGRQMKLLDAQINNVKADTENKDADTEGKNISNSYADQLNQAQLAILEKDYWLKDASIQQIEQLIKNEKVQQSILSMNLTEETEKLAILGYQKVMAQMESEYKNDFLSLQNQLLRNQGQYYSAMANNQTEQLENIKLERGRILAQIDNLEQDTVLKMYEQGLIDQQTENAAVEWAIKNEQLSQEEVKTKYASKAARAQLVCSYLNAGANVIGAAGNLVHGGGYSSNNSTTTTVYDANGNVTGSTVTKTSGKTKR